jgi:antirestriction protein ArdC
MKEQRFDIHQHITDQIVAAIEKGAGEFRLPWHRSAGSIMRPVNVASKKAYQGVNILTLWAAGDAAGYQSGTWGTYKQWTEAGAQVKKGEKASYIVFYKEFTVEGDQGSDETETRLFARATPVFAAEQVDGFASPAPEPKTVVDVVDDIIAAERFIAGTGALILHAGERACYRPSTDTIHLPPREAFCSTATSTAAEAYYSTKLHEIGNAASVLVIGVVIAIAGRAGRYESASIWGWLIRW